MTSSPPYKCGDSSPRRNLRIGERSLNGVDASQIVARKQVLHNLHVRFKSRTARPRLKLMNKIFSFLVPSGRIVRCPWVLSLLPSQTRFHSLWLVYRCKMRWGFQPRLLYQKAVLEGRGLYPNFSVKKNRIAHTRRMGISTAKLHCPLDCRWFNLGSPQA